MKFPVEKMCRVLAVSKSGYYNWLKQGSSKRWIYNQKLTILISTIFDDSFESYGVPRIQVELEQTYGAYVSRPRVARIMQANYLYARRTRKFRVTTNSNHKYPIAPNILNQNFRVSRINQVWVSDMTYVQTNQGWMYLTVILDLFNRKVVGWSMSDNLTTEHTIVRAWNMAIRNNDITEELIFHSDREVHSMQVIRLLE